MKISRFLFSILGISFIPVVSFAWGTWAHMNITAAAVQDLPLSMYTVFASSSTFLIDSSTDNGVRTGWDPNESYFHYIDLGGANTGSCQWPFACMPQTIPDFLSQYGTDSLGFNGYIEDSILTYCLSTALANWKASPTPSNYTTVMIWMCRVAHYMEDLSQPLHVCWDYDPNGVHSRYETNMLDTFTPTIAAPSNLYSYQTNIIQYSYTMISTSFPYWTAITSADTYAEGSAHSTSNDLYYTLLWSSTQSFTTTLLDASVITVDSLWYTAWVNAGFDTVPVDHWELYAADKVAIKP